MRAIRGSIALGIALVLVLVAGFARARGRPESWLGMPTEVVTPPAEANETRPPMSPIARAAAAEIPPVARQTPPVVPVVPDAPPPKVSASLPWTLRPASVANVVRLDGAVALQSAGVGFASTLLAMARFAPDFGVLARVAIAHTATEDFVQSAFGNLVLGLAWTPTIAPHVRLPLFAGAALPVASGSGDRTPGEDVPLGYKALAAGAAARGSMDNMLFAGNYLAFAFGAGLAYVADNGFTVQAEATIFALGRSRGDAYEPDDEKSNLTAGVHIGHTVANIVTVSLEGRYQRWLSTPAAVLKDDAKRDTLTAGIGIRTKIVLAGGAVTLRPGIAYFEPLDDPLAGLGYHFFLFDVPAVF